MALDIAAALSRGYISMDAADALSTFMTNGMPDRARFLNFLGNLIVTAADAERKSKHVAVFAECVHLLWAQGNPEATIRLEGLWNEEIVSRYDVGTLRL